MGSPDQARDEHGRWTSDGGSTVGHGTGTKHSMKDLHAAAIKAGKSLYGKDSSGLLYEKNNLVQHANLSEVKVVRGDPMNYEGEAKNEAATATVDTFEYVFDPETGKGIDVSEEAIRAKGAGRDANGVKPEWVSRDGNIYIAHSDQGIRVIHTGNDKPHGAPVDRTFKKETPQERFQRDREARYLREPTLKIADQAYSKHDRGEKLSSTEKEALFKHFMIKVK